MTKVNVHLSGLLLCLSLSFMPLLLEATPTVSCGTTISSFPYTESFETGLGDWSNGGPNNLWQRDASGTTSGGTGPSSGDNGTSYYVYTEASTNNVGFPNKINSLVGPCFDLSSATTASFSFSYHMWGAYIGDLSLQISTDGGTNWSTLWALSGDQGNQWFQQTVDLNSYAGQTVKLRFYGITGSSWAGDMAVDELDLSINTSPPSGLSCTSTISSFPYNESFESGLGLWEDEASINIWLRGSGHTPSNNPPSTYITGPLSAIDGTYYMFTESSSPNYSYKVEAFDSPCFDLTQQSQASFHFSYHMFGTTIGTLKLLIQSDNDTNWSPIWLRAGNHGTEWKNASVDLSAYTGQKIRLRFEVTTGTSYTGDIAIDDISLTATPVSVTAGCNTTISSFPYTESFESGLGDWYEQSAIALWIRNSGATPSYASGFGTGPSSAQSGSYYMYSEGDNVNSSHNSSYLTGPCFDLSNASSASFTFYYHMYRFTGINFFYTAGLNLEVSTNNGTTWNSIWSKVGYQGGWQAAIVDLSAYVGQTIQLRFQSQHNLADNNDIGIDNILLDAPTTPSNGSIQASVEFPQTSSCSVSGQSYCCDEATLSGMPVPNIGIDILDINSQVINATTNGVGDFSASPAAGAVTLTPVVNTADWNNGISTFDIIKIQQHIDGTSIINCPLQRLAADVDNDGDIDNTDISYLQDLNLNIITSIPGGNNWKCVAKGYIQAEDVHPDERFLADFWNTAAEDPSGNEYPFKAKLNKIDQDQYSYYGTNDWMDELKTTLNGAVDCNSTDFGFYIVKSGDVNSSASYTNFDDPYGPPAARSGNLLTPLNPNQARLAKINASVGSLDLRSKGNKKYQVKIIAESSTPIMAYQMGIRFDDEIMSLGKIKPNREELNQLEAKNFGQAKKGFRGGELKTQWFADLKQEPLGKRFNRSLTIMSFEFQSKADLEQVEKAFSVDHAIQEIQFIGKEGLIHGVDLQVFVEPIK